MYGMRSAMVGALCIKQDGIRMFYDCDEEEGILTSGKDDKVFRLKKTSLEACRALESKVGDK
jgi:hypothetical protein